MLGWSPGGVWGTRERERGAALTSSLQYRHWNFLSPSLSHQDVLCTPTHRLLQDSQDIPVVVTPLRAERVLLFDDTLVLLQVRRG